MGAAELSKIEACGFPYRDRTKRFVIVGQKALPYLRWITNSFRLAPISTGLRVVIWWRMILMTSGVTFSAKLLNETIKPVANEPEYSKGAPVKVFPKGIAVDLKGDCIKLWYGPSAV